MSELVTQREASRKSYDRYNNSLTRPYGLYGTDTGSHDLNMITQGHVATKITTFAGRSGLGKSSLLVPMMDSSAIVANGRRTEILVGSWEMESSYLIDRYICWKLGVTLQQLRYPKALPEAIQKKIVQIYQDGSKLPLHYHHYSSNFQKTAEIIYKFLDEVKKKEIIEGVKIQPVFFLDFIGRIQASGKNASKTYDISEFMMGLKQLCNETDLSAFVLAQINRSADIKDFPDVADLSDSQSIEQNSDTLIIGHRPEYYGKEVMKDPENGQDIPSRNRMLWRVVKAREGTPHDRIVHCDMAHFRFWHRNHPDWDYKYYEDYGKEEFWKREMGLM